MIVENSYLWFVAVALAASAAGISAYALMNREPWPLSTRIGIGFAGAAVGSFGGVMFAGAAGLHQKIGFVAAAAIASTMSIAFQWKARRGFEWHDFF